MKSMINILIAAFAFVIAFGIAILTGNNLVKHAVLLAFVINWIAYVLLIYYRLKSSMT